MKLGHSHRELLKRLTAGPRDTHFFTHGDNLNSQLGFHFTKYLPQMAQKGLVVEIEDLWHITQAGRDFLEEKPAKKNKERISAGTTVGTYDGHELTETCLRPGAYDYKKYPSLMGNNRVFQRGA